MNVETLQEQFSVAYVRAIATVAGFTVTKPEVDCYSVDLQIESDVTMPVAYPRIGIQAKCTSTDDEIGPYLIHDLKAKNYRDLRLPSQVPSLLVVVCVASQLPADWIDQRPIELALLGRGYYLSLKDAKEKPNPDKVRVKIPRAQRLTVESLRALMAIVADGGRP